MQLEKLTPEWFRNKKVVVMGLGLHGGGLGTTIWMMRQGANVTVTDLRDQHVLAPSIAEVEKAFILSQKELGRDKTQRVRYVLGKHDEEDFAGADLVMQNPGVPRESQYLEVARKNGVRIENEASIFFQLCPFPIIGITGTRGKTTTTTLVGAIAKLHDRRSVIAGNIRISMLGLLDSLLEKKDAKKQPFVVLELSSWHLELLEQHRLSPHVGVITNIYPDHLNRYRDLDDYASAKANIVVHQHARDIAVLNADNPMTKKIGHALHGTVMWFGLKDVPVHAKHAVFVHEGEVIIRRDDKEESVVMVDEIPVPGEHNVMNVLAAVAATASAGISLEDIREGILAFTGVPNRQELLAIIRDVRWINDTTATSPDASIVALRTFGEGADHKRVILISGGADKKLEFHDWAKSVAAYAKMVILFDGTATPRMEEALREAKCAAPMVGARNMDEAVKIAEEHALAGDVVLLSPGCASFGMFLHEFDRGEQFIRAVKRLTKKK